MDIVGRNAGIMRLVAMGSVLTLCFIRGIVVVAVTSANKEVIVSMECAAMQIN